MKNVFINLLLFIFCFTAYAQQKIRFNYDAAGNQIVREYCLNCVAKNLVHPKEISKLEETDLEKFFPEDKISFYPNPVKEELFLKWELTNDSTVTELKVFNINGILLRTINNLNNVNSYNMAFSEYPQGVYLVELKYNTEEVKTIKIIKK